MASQKCLEINAARLPRAVPPICFCTHMVCSDLDPLVCRGAVPPICFCTHMVCSDLDPLVCRGAVPPICFSTHMVRSDLDPLVCHLQEFTVAPTPQVNKAFVTKSNPIEHKRTQHSRDGGRLFLCNVPDCLYFGDKAPTTKEGLNYERRTQHSNDGGSLAPCNDGIQAHPALCIQSQSKPATLFI